MRPVTVSVLLADDQELVRASMRVMIDVEPDLVVVAEAADGEAAVEPAVRLRPDVVVMDVRMPRLDGVAATRPIMAQASPPTMLPLTTDLAYQSATGRRASASEVRAYSHEYRWYAALGSSSGWCDRRAQTRVHRPGAGCRVPGAGCRVRGLS